MKIKLSIILIFAISSTAFSQLNKTILESQFPLLALPYELNPSMIPMYEPSDGKMNPKKYSFLKDNVTDLVFGAMMDEQTNTMSSYLMKKTVKTATSEIRAIGRFNIGKQNFIVYNLNDTKSDAYINVVYVASLDANYKIVDISNILFYAIFSNPDKSYKITQLLRQASLSNGKILLKEMNRLITTVDADGKKTLNDQKSNNAYIFNDSGKIENLIIISK